VDTTALVLGDNAIYGFAREREKRDFHGRVQDPEQGVFNF
jgi:hypothetical protein